MIVGDLDFRIGGTVANIVRRRSKLGNFYIAKVDRRGGCGLHPVRSLISV